MSRAQAYLAPVLLAVALIVHAYAPTHSHWSVVLRPGLVVLVAVLIVTALCLAIFKRPGPVAAAICFAVLVMYEWRIALLAGGLVVLVIAARRVVLRRRDEMTAQVLLVPIVVFLALGIVRIVGTGTVALKDFTPPMAVPAASSGEAGRPNIYLLLLDGYPRQDTLAQDFGSDNEPFLRELEGLGFTVNREARSTFANTELSLASTQVSSPEELDAYYVDGESGPQSVAEPREVRRALLVNTEPMSTLRDLGYRLAYIPPPVSDVEWRGWDVRRDPGQLTEFEVALVQQTPMRSLLGGWLLDQARDRTVDSLDLWSQPVEGQQLTFAHLMAPHPPFVWDGAREVERPTECWLANTCSLFAGFGLGMPPDDYAARMGAQVEGLNAVLIPAIQRIVADDPLAVIVIFSDHGTRYLSESSEEARRTLFAARGTSATSIDGLFPHLLRELGAAR